MNDSTAYKDTSKNVDAESISTTTTTTPVQQQTVVCVITEEMGVQYLPMSEARSIIEKQYSQIINFTSKMKELENKSELINNYFAKSTEINNQLLGRYRKLLDWIIKGGVSILLLSIILIAVPLFLFIYRFNANDSLETLKSVLWWIVGLYGVINVGGLFTWGLATFGFKKQLDNLEKRTERIEDKL